MTAQVARDVFGAHQTRLTVHPVTTHAMSGLGTVNRDNADWCRAPPRAKASRYAA